jgi:hydrogenase maturation protease
MVKSLVIGYGNSFRSDDGIGAKVAEIVAVWQFPEVRSLSCHQLTPELAADLAEVDLAIFVDATPSVKGAKIELRSLNIIESTQIRSHFSDPCALLSLTQAIYGKSPQGWWLIVPGINFELGDSLSPVAEKGVSQAVTQIKNLIFSN